MNKGLIAGLIALLVVVGGVVFFVSSSSDSDDASQDTASSEAANESSQSSNEENNEAAELDFDNVFNADLTSLTSDIRVDVTGPDTVGFIEIAESGDVRLEITTDGQTSEFIQVGESAYFRDVSTEQWFAYDLGIDAISEAFTQGIEPEVFEAYEAEGVQENGEVSCVSGTCRSYTFTDDGEEVTLLVDAQTNRISEWSGIDSETGETITFTYSYDQELDISAPEDVQEFGL